jgi:hypothetical protein
MALLPQGKLLQFHNLLILTRRQKLLLHRKIQRIHAEAAKCSIAARVTRDCDVQRYSNRS